MKDTNDMRREFESLAKTHDFDLTPDDCDEGFYKSSRTDCAWIFWQAATERATAVERERCAVQAEKATKNNRVIVASIDGVPTSACFIATAIRQGGAA